MKYRKKKDVLLEDVDAGRPFLCEGRLYIASVMAETNIELPGGKLDTFWVDDTMVTPLTMVGFKEELKLRGMIPQ